jgi:ABC-type glycerol-3-phosphate transport system permease component
MTRRARRSIKHALAVAVAVTFTGVLLVPLVWVVSTSIRPIEEVVVVPPRIIPKTITFRPYIDMWTAAPFVRYTANSVIISTLTAIIGLAFSTCAAYAFARFRFRGRDLLLILTIMAQMIPGVSILLPLFQVIRSLALLDTRTGLIIVYTGFVVPFCTWLLNGYFRSIPADLEDAGLIDGCSRLQVLYHVVLPLSAPAMVAVGVFAFLTAWNEFLFALVFTKTHAATMPVGLRAAFSTQYYNLWNQLSAASLVFSLPPVILFIALQRHFVKGLTAGAVKG